MNASYCAHGAMPLHCVRVRQGRDNAHRLHRRQLVQESFQECHHHSRTRLQRHHQPYPHRQQPESSSPLWSASTSSSTDCNQESIPHNHHHHHLAKDQPRNGSSSPSRAGGPSTFHLNQCGPAETQFLLPLPPVIHRMEMAGSPFLPYDPSQDYEPFHPCQTRAENTSGGARTHSNGGGASGGGGGDGSSTTADDMSPGGGDATDGDQPSSYTFRRRNAIVEGSEDAPKADDFPGDSPK